MTYICSIHVANATFANLIPDNRDYFAEFPLFTCDLFSIKLQNGFFLQILISISVELFSGTTPTELN